jgi:hypothetical protein
LIPKDSPFRFSNEIYRRVLGLFKLNHRIAAEFSEIDFPGLGVFAFADGPCVDRFDELDVEAEELLILEAEDERLANGDCESSELQKEFLGHQIGVVGLQSHTKKKDEVKNR